MSNPNVPRGTQVDPSEDTIDEGQSLQQENLEASDAEGQGSAPLNVDPSEGAIE